MMDNGYNRLFDNNRLGRHPNINTALHSLLIYDEQYFVRVDHLAAISSQG